VIDHRLNLGVKELTIASCYTSLAVVLTLSGIIILKAQPCTIRSLSRGSVRSLWIHQRTVGCLLAESVANRAVARQTDGRMDVCDGKQTV